MAVVAFIFARGGSKGLPGKNIKPLAGKPLLAYSIETAKQVNEIDHVFVSTDDSDIANVAKQFGADVIERPEQLASDTSPEWLSWRHALDEMDRLEIEVDTFVSLPATSPLRSVGDVQACLAALEQNTDMVVTCTPASRSPYFNMVTRQDDGTTSLVIDQGLVNRRQDAPVCYDLTTVAYVSRPEYIRSQMGVLAGKTKSVVVPKERAVDIDDIYDFMLAETIVASSAQQKSN
ncbi:acylneuraminate cytidylyltransferase family protein [Psychrosphaera ytuae]|uniref:Acylneuraminate cytidylyltransferase family protein n=1 Tax=Psychrosphaera ytuae TaxID=2820710 RepID=A0A975HI61_9GAMM|nr:acylneuraminate cytidylyltransferase family protein [Psychrosphaera ytuae]QTH63808.1 acylneuraminate cytidylyltransferase family protein [Psychrosphaera ytuae]